MEVVKSKEVIEMCQILAEQEQLKVCVQESVKAGLYAGCGAIFGGLFGGPIGVAVGGTLGSITAAWWSKDKFKSVVDVLKNDLTPGQQQKLITHMNVVLRRIKPEDCISLITIVLSSASLKELVIKEIGAFLLKELNLSMVENSKMK